MPIINWVLTRELNCDQQEHITLNDKVLRVHVEVIMEVVVEMVISIRSLNSEALLTIFARQYQQKYQD